MEIPDILKSQARLLFERGAISYEEYVILRSDSRFSRAIVMSAVIMITFYMLVICQFTYLNIENHTNVFPPVEFTTGYFAFWTVEIVMLASLKKHNIANKHEKQDTKTDIIQGVLGRFSTAGSVNGRHGKEEPQDDIQGDQEERPE